ncbi:MAG: metallophosphoesterase [Muribaculaceae bacterium]|nr:metallophosphoesterase [Muribaculaceae bacterium]
MKHFLLTAWCLLSSVMAPAINATNMQSDEPHKIMVISDIHLLAPSLYDDDKAAQQLNANDIKLVLQSDLIMQRFVNEILDEKPQLLLISGDLTFNGEKASHERLAEHLQRLEQAGVRTLVIPGNHDVMCPSSKQYIGDKPAAVSNVTSEEFAEIYAHFGYGSDSQRDPASLSYTCEPIPGIMLLCIDSNIYAQSRDNEVAYHTDGRVKPETLEWIKQQLAAAQKSDKRVIAMMHHHLVEHIDGEKKLLPNYIVANHSEVAQVLRDGGVKVIFTGHLHITDAATESGITDVATGSASTYPLPMRTAIIDPSLNTITIETSFFENIDKSILEKGRGKIENSAPVLAALISRRLWPRMESRLKQYEPLLAEQGIDTSRLPRDARDVSNLITKHLREPLTESLMAVTLGGEDPAQAQAIVGAIKNGVQQMMTEIFGDGGESVATFLLSNLMPRVEPTLRSALEDLNQVGTDHQSATHDHQLTIKL